LLVGTGLGAAGDNAVAWHRPEAHQDRGRTSQREGLDRRHRLVVNCRVHFDVRHLQDFPVATPCDS